MYIKKMKYIQQCRCGSRRGGEASEVERTEEPMPDDDDIREYQLAKEDNPAKPFTAQAFFQKLTENAPPKVRKFIEDYGEYEVEDAYICRKPVNKPSVNLINFLTKGKLEETRKRLEALNGEPYEKFFHLFVEVEVDGKWFRLEKIQRVDVNQISERTVDDRSKFIQCLHQPPTKRVTVLDMFKRGEKNIGVTKFWIYDLGVSNCQSFALGILGSGNGMLTDSGRRFGKQDAKQLVPEWILKVFKVTTDIANRLSSFISGRGGVCGNKCTCDACGGGDNPFKEDYHKTSIKYLRGAIRGLEDRIEETKKWEESAHKNWNKNKQSGLFGFLKKIIGWIPLVGDVLQYIPDVGQEIHNAIIKPSFENSIKAIQNTRAEFEKSLAKANEQLDDALSTSKEEYNRREYKVRAESIGERKRQNPDWNPNYQLPDASEFAEPEDEE